MGLAIALDLGRLVERLPFLSRFGIGGVERRAFGMGVFLTIYYAIITAAPPVAGWLFDRTGAADGAILFGVALFALVFPAAALFRMIKTRAADTRIEEIA